MYNGKKIMIGLSAGINSMAVLCWLVKQRYKPSVLYLYYAHFEEHSPDSFRFVADGIRYARKHFENVVVKITRNSVLAFFEEQKMIPHPTASPCTRLLKILPMEAYAFENDIEIDLIGYIRTEKRRINNMQKNRTPSLFLEKDFPIQLLDDEWCFEIVDEQIGWHPKIYDLRWNDPAFMEYVQSNLHRFEESVQTKLLKKIGKNRRVFHHNNCLPCKNMEVDDLLAVEYFYPEKIKKANELSQRLQSHWGRNADEYYTTFGKQDYESTQCEVCAFD